MKKIRDWTKLTDDEIWSYLNTGGDVNARDEDEGTALMAAASSGNVHLAEQLVLKKADVNAQDSNGVTALMITGRMHTLGENMGSHLLKAGITVESFRDNLVQIGKLLVQNKAQLNTQKSDNWDALMFWVEAGNIEMVKFLTANGARVHTLTVEVAIYHRHTAIAQLLRDINN